MSDSGHIGGQGCSGLLRFAACASAYHRATARPLCTSKWWCSLCATQRFSLWPTNSDENSLRATASIWTPSSRSHSKRDTTGTEECGIANWSTTSLTSSRNRNIAGIRWPSLSYSANAFLGVGTFIDRAGFCSNVPFSRHPNKPGQNNNLHCFCFISCWMLGPHPYSPYFLHGETREIVRTLKISPNVGLPRDARMLPKLSERSAPFKITASAAIPILVFCSQEPQDIAVLHREFIPCALAMTDYLEWPSAICVS